MPILQDPRIAVGIHETIALGIRFHVLWGHSTIIIRAGTAQFACLRLGQSRFHIAVVTSAVPQLLVGFQEGDITDIVLT